MYVLSIDQSTTGTKVAVLDEDLQIKGRKYMPHKTHTMENGWITHEPQEIWENVVQMLSELSTEYELTENNTSGMGISVQTGAFVLWDSLTGKEYTPIIGWQSTFGEEVVHSLTPEQIRTIKEETKIEPEGTFIPGKLAYILRSDQTVQEALEHRTLCVGTIDTWLIWKLTGGKKHVTEPGNASVSQMMNLETLSWSRLVLSCFNIPEYILPQILSNDSDFGHIQVNGLISIPINGVLGDSNAALYYQNCFQKGQMKITYGTGVSVLINLGSTLPTDSEGIFCVAAWKIDNHTCYCGEGTVFYAGALITWMQKNLGLFGSPEQTDQMASSLEDNGQVYFIPSFDSKGKGFLAGVDLSTGKEHIVRAVLESIAYQVKDIVDDFEQRMGCALNEIYCDGGLTGNRFLMEFQSALLNRELFISKEEEASLIGAALLASGFRNTKKAAAKVCSLMDENTRLAYMEKWHRLLNEVTQST